MPFKARTKIRKIFIKVVTEDMEAATTVLHTTPRRTMVVAEPIGGASRHETLLSSTTIIINTIITRKRKSIMCNTQTHLLISVHYNPNKLPALKSQHTLHI